MHKNWEISSAFPVTIKVCMPDDLKICPGEEQTSQ
jgi:hypothetical protein